MRHFALLAVFAAPILASCTASIPSVDVTRFHLGQQIPPGPFQLLDDSAMDAVPYREAVAQALIKLGFARGGSGDALYGITITKARTVRDESKAPSISIGIGGATGGRVSIGGGTAIGLGGGRRQIVVTELRVQIRRAGDQQVIWEGRAETEAPASAPASQPGLAAQKLATALFADFPGESGKSVTIP